MKKFAVIGNPINHSLSPLLHQSIFQQIGLSATYEKVQLEPFEIKDFIMSNELDGYNVTIPYKNRILNYLRYLDIDAKSITAVNCVSNHKGYNTDWIGFIKTLDHNKIDLMDKHTFKPFNSLIPKKNVFQVSAKSNVGIEKLRSGIESELFKDFIQEKLSLDSSEVEKLNWLYLRQLIVSAKPVGNKIEININWSQFQKEQFKRSFLA